MNYGKEFHYWYFSYQIQKEGRTYTDDAVTVSADRYFPISSVLRIFDESFKDGGKIVILGAVEIDRAAFDAFADK